MVGRERLEQVEEYIERAVEAQEPAFVMVAGLKGTGRTSICNHLLYHYRRCRAIPDKRLFVPQPHYQGEDPHAYFAAWLEQLYGDLDDGDAPLGDAKLEAVLGSGNPLPSEQTYVDRARRLLRTASRLLALDPAAAFAACIEDPRDYSLVRAAFSVFAQSQTLVLVTVLDPFDGHNRLKRLFRQHAPQSTTVHGSSYPVLELELVQGHEARDLIERRWRSCGNGHDSPFDGDGLESTFEHRRRTAGRVVLLTHGMLGLKAASAGHGAAWPEAKEELFLRGDQIRDLVTQIDRGDLNVDD